MANIVAKTLITLADKMFRQGCLIMTYCTTGALSALVRKANAGNLKATYGSLLVTKFPASVFIASLLDSGEIVQPVAKNFIPEL